jgi:hypothetical protein
MIAIALSGDASIVVSILAAFLKPSSLSQYTLQPLGSTFSFHAGDAIFSLYCASFSSN